MASGGRRMIWNSQERAVSTDHNRAQFFAGKDRGEIWRYLLDVSAGADDLDAGALDTEFLTQENPLRGEILNGLLVQPQAGSLNLIVTPGAAFVIDPDTLPSADDSAYKFIGDPGVQALGALAMTSNASGSTRIDVIECQRTESIVETDNRDIFNPSTGTFVATTVTKGMSSVFTYRVRAGTPGAGFPGTAQGWLPLAVASVPTGTTTNDTITFWDVRPLVNDRAFAPMNLSRAMPMRHRGLGKLELPDASHSNLTGLFEYSLGARRVGGRMRRGTPGTDGDVINLQDAANQETGIVLAAQLGYVYIAQPFGLPRWARYTDGPSGRVPRSPRGIVIASMKIPNIDGTPSSALALPASTGLGGTTSNAVCIVATLCSSSQFGFGGIDDGKSWSWGPSATPYAANATTTANGSATWTMPISQSPSPPNAKALLVGVDIQENTVLGANANFALRNVWFQCLDSGGTVVAQTLVANTFVSNATGSGVLVEWGAVARVPVPNDYPTLVLANWTLKLIWRGFGGAPNSASLAVQGWEL